MRIWSVHPKYLDSKGLVALWRETLLAKHVLEGKTKGYKNHPQLDRFKVHPKPLDAINSYLDTIHQESVERDYNFNSSKFKKVKNVVPIKVTSGQIEYEVKHLLSKLKTRDPILYKVLKGTKIVEQHPIFKITKGEIEKWEIV